MSQAETVIYLKRPGEFEDTATSLLSKGREIDGVMTVKGFDPQIPWDAYLLRGHGNDTEGYEDIHVHYIFNPQPYYYQLTYSFSRSRGIYSIREFPLRERTFMHGYLADERQCGVAEEIAFKEANKLIEPPIYNTALASLTRRLMRIPLWFPLAKFSS